MSVKNLNCLENKSMMSMDIALLHYQSSIILNVHRSIHCKLLQIHYEFNENGDMDKDADVDRVFYKTVVYFIIFSLFLHCLLGFRSS